MSDDETHILCRIEGRVQQVGYRAWTQASAARLGVRGWVRNESDGSVSACFAGPTQSVRALIEACREGPSAAAVTAVIEQPAPTADTGDGDCFDVRY